ncbi:MAG: Asp-tRNA(Asn)/Glu-tRNA(Gln) amidotransferase subunit GatC [Trueperaceae bacterium]|nr:Asp-tRNA(Asn)/Glu-tRNA(Gln) amidotransferase subunit GatC [Trueperaceae bacterium]
MSISDQDIEHLKQLARLQMSDEETQALKEDLNKTLGYFEDIRDLDTSAVDELARPIDSVNVFREDVVVPPLPHSDVIALATESEDGFFKVPRTVDAE